MIIQTRELHYKKEFLFRIITRLTSHASRANRKLVINTANLRDKESAFAMEQHYNIAGCFNNEDNTTQTGSHFSLLSNNAVTYFSYAKGQPSCNPSYIFSLNLKRYRGEYRNGSLFEADS